MGDILTYLGPLKPVRDALNANPITINNVSATIPNMLGIGGWVLLLIWGVITAVTLTRTPRANRGKLWNWLILGIATSLFMSIAWLLAKTGGSNYTYGTSGVPSGIITALTGDGSDGNLWIPIALLSIIPGAFIAAKQSGTWSQRGETSKRYVQLGVGGFLMGIGAGIAGGCNLGHSLVGVPLLSLGSITTTIAMAAGVFIAHRFVKN
ncbi:MAG: YeeE/YedE family protein, partial [Chloroflexi bacterium]|nr:YeeE/YedE family protein [Chloroflexota bacterium]